MPSHSSNIFDPPIAQAATYCDLGTRMGAKLTILVEMEGLDLLCGISYLIVVVSKHNSVSQLRLWVGSLGRLERSRLLSTCC